MYFFLGLICTTSILGVVGIAGPETHRALLFDRYTRAVIDIPDNEILEGNSGNWATACPASKENTIKDDLAFIKQHTLTKTPLFVEKIYHEKDLKKDVKQYICETPFRMTILHNLQNFKFEFGYEVFHKAKEEFIPTGYENYYTIRETIQAKRSLFRIGTVHFTRGPFNKRLRNVFYETFGDRWYKNTWTIRWLWIPMFKLKFFFPPMRISTLTYTMRRNKNWPLKIKCEDYSLGSEAYDGYDNLGVDVDKLYTNQRKLFQHLKLPTKQSCNSNYTCLEKWSLIPLHQFHFIPNSPPQCSHLTTVPIWTDVTKAVLEKIDLYLYALFRFLNTPLEIISGLKGDLEVPGRMGLVNHTVYLEPDLKKISVPRIIYKIVKYFLPGCDRIFRGPKICNYSVIIILHNDPYFKPRDRLCPERNNIAEKWGWDAIKKGSDGKLYKNVYVCPNTKELLDKLFMKLSHDRQSTTRGQLDLSQFPALDFSQNVIGIAHNNIIEKVNAKLEQLLEKGDIDSENDDIKKP